MRFEMVEVRFQTKCGVRIKIGAFMSAKWATIFFSFKLPGGKQLRFPLSRQKIFSIAGVLPRIFGNLVDLDGFLETGQHILPTFLIFSITDYARTVFFFDWS